MAGTGGGVLKLERVILHPEAGVAAASVYVLEAVRAPLVGFKQETETVWGFSAVMGMGPVGRIHAAGGHQHPAHLFRNGRRDHVQRAAYGVRPLGDRRRPLQHLKGVHAPRCGKVVRRGRRIRRGRDQHIVLQQGDAAAALRGDSPYADVGAQPVPVFHLNGNARHFPSDALHIRIGKLFQLLRTDEIRGTGNALGPFPAAHDSDFILNVPGLLREVFLRGEGPRPEGRHGQCGRQDAERQPQGQRTGRKSAIHNYLLLLTGND